MLLFTLRVFCVLSLCLSVSVRRAHTQTPLLWAFFCCHHHNDLGDGGGRAVAGALETHSTLTSLNLQVNGVGGEIEYQVHSLLSGREVQRVSGVKCAVAAQPRGSERNSAD